MEKIEVTHKPDYSEYVAKNEELNELTIMWVRPNSTAVVKLRNNELLECQTFGSGPMQKFREMYFKAHPLTDNERYKQGE